VSTKTLILSALPIVFQGLVTHGSLPFAYALVKSICSSPTISTYSSRLSSFHANLQSIPTLIDNSAIRISNEVLAIGTITFLFYYLRSKEHWLPKACVTIGSYFLASFVFNTSKKMF